MLWLANWKLPSDHSIERSTSSRRQQILSWSKDSAAASCEQNYCTNSVWVKIVTFRIPFQIPFQIPSLPFMACIRGKHCARKLNWFPIPFPCITHCATRSPATFDPTSGSKGIFELRKFPWSFLGHQTAGEGLTLSSYKARYLTALLSRQA